ncbi:hypothetical protein [Rhodococcus sp. 05-2255-1e]|uniref:hypothetical protein n=1 Tax=Rhodococcus sp. 05-2255-1e TaxID=2022495 RepID=UPI00117AE4F2|nr:hypothetical protein [Rhodococcus sp. 05-2255-1e]
MLLAQEPVQEIIVQSATPWWTIGSAVLVALIGWYVIHRTSKSRDRENWRRDTLTRAVSELLESSNTQLDLITSILNYKSVNKESLTDPMAELVKSRRRTERSIEQISICIAPKVKHYADHVFKLNRTHAKNVALYIKDAIRQLDTEVLDDLRKQAQPNTKELKFFHRQLIRSLQEEIGLTGIEIDPDHAYVTTSQPGKIRSKAIHYTSKLLEKLRKSSVD